MLSVRARPELASLLREKLQQRLAAVGEGPNAPLAQSPLPAVAEEALRQLMVRYRPRIQNRSMADEDVTGILDVAAVVASATQIDDLRFIDALNATFEVWAGEYRAETRAAFLGIYRPALHGLVNP